MTPSKYGNRKTTVDGHVFDSAKEARRYEELKLMRSAQKKSERVVSIEIQPEFELIPKNGKERAMNYRADFRVTYADGRVEIEDVKGYRTEVYKIKRKLLLWLYRDDPDFIFKEI